MGYESVVLQRSLLFLSDIDPIFPQYVDLN